jgi:hypothetical protein
MEKNLKNIMLSKRNQAHKTKHRTVTFIRISGKGETIETEIRLIFSRSWGRKNEGLQRGRRGH